ncbi:hypothetical protein ISR92_03155 [Patescibacteria group bacterium]|nr:hypothetical protein [Patescibacteria group bacterium]
MRNVLSISLQNRQLDKIKTSAKKRGFGTVSSYIKFLVDEDNDLISAKDLRKIADKAQQDYNTGRVIKAKSISDLL